MSARRGYSFCETATATGTSPWHIRRLTGRGRKFSGGADTPALCGANVAWDLKVDLTEHHLAGACRKCGAVFAAGTYRLAALGGAK